MGCDIHGPWIEQLEGTNDRGHQNWECIAQLQVWRNYELFGALAGVRRDLPHVAPKGIPQNLSHEVFAAFTLFVDTEYNELNDGTCLGKDAARWIEEQSSRSMQAFKNGQPQRISHPDWHTPSWLTTTEVAGACARVDSRQLKGALAMMRAMETETHPIRMVFWFDN